MLNPRPVRAFLITRTVGGIDTSPPPRGDWLLIELELRDKSQSMRLAEISRFRITFLVLGQYLTSIGQVKCQMFAKNILSLHANSGLSVCRSDLKPSPACFLLNSEQDRVLLLYPVAIFSIGT